MHAFMKWSNPDLSGRIEIILQDGNQDSNTFSLSSITENYAWGVCSDAMIMGGASTTWKAESKYHKVLHQSMPLVMNSKHCLES